MYRRQMERGRRSRRGVVPMLERRTVWRDCSLSPVTGRDRYVAENTLGCYQNRFERRDNFTINESNSRGGRQMHRQREHLDNNKLSRSRISPTSARTGPMQSRIYLQHELTKHCRERGALLTLDGARSEEIRSTDEDNPSADRMQSLEYGDSRAQNYHVRGEPQLAAEGIARKISNNLSNWRIEDLLGGHSVLNADSIQNAQTWITNDNGLSPAQVLRARELLQELLITISTRPDIPVTEDRPLNFVTDRRISDYNTPSRSFSQHSSHSSVRSDPAMRERELSLTQNSLPVGVPLTLLPQNWHGDSMAVYSNSSEMSMSSREMPKYSDYRCSSRNDYQTPYMENAEFGNGNVREHDPTLLGSEKRRPYHEDHRRISRSRSRSIGKVCSAGIGERRVHMKSRGFISVEVNHLQKRSRRNYLPYELIRNRENGAERSLRRSLSLTRRGRSRR
ncbi:unnamed protein product [Litomosoides sigmodontis]|uniref:Uncharacterized protein n=1 Tax=Litomosoides sigmodontis TaxID=42156 RepID=A0A3P6V2Y3_LITSI|nr:unnamed protein product [Litomosoides sigmodontis]